MNELTPKLNHYYYIYDLLKKKNIFIKIIQCDKKEVWGRIHYMVKYKDVDTGEVSPKYDKDGYEILSLDDFLFENIIHIGTELSDETKAGLML